MELLQFFFAAQQIYSLPLLTVINLVYDANSCSTSTIPLPAVNVFCSAQSWSGRFRSRAPSRQTWRRTPGSRSRTSSCPQSGRVSQPEGRVTQRMTNSCVGMKIDTVHLRPVFPPRALEMPVKILLSPGRVVFQDSCLSRNF